MLLPRPSCREPSTQIALFAPASEQHTSEEDSLGRAYCLEHNATSRRKHGITLTPAWLVSRMFEEVGEGEFDTVVDAGAGSGRFTVAAARRFPNALIVAVESHRDMLDLLHRRLHQEGLADRVQVVEGDFRSADLPRRGRCLYIGNPPYVRHHDIEPGWKAWYRDRMRSQGIAASQLAGLHLHFLLRATELGQPGDALCFVTSSEWLDNDYGAAARALLTRPSGFTLRSLWVTEPGEAVFPDALVSSAVVHARFDVDGAATARARTGTIASQALTQKRLLPVHAFHESNRWSNLCRLPLPVVSGGIELGELYRVTRGQVTGNNQVWVLSADECELPSSLTVAAVTRAREIIDGSVLSTVAAQRFKRVVDLPRDLDSLAPSLRAAAEAFVERAKRLGADQGYVARHRKPWFALDMRLPPQAFVSYMGRRTPVFAANPLRLSFINIAHGLYPRIPICATGLQNILAHLNQTTSIFDGRVYGGGMAKFEPSDISRLRIPEAVLAGAE